MDNIKGKNRGKWKRYVGVLCCCLLAWVAVSAQEKLYHAADWGVKPGLKTVQTEQLQRMIDEVAAGEAASSACRLEPTSPGVSN